MAKHIVVVDKKKDWLESYPRLEVVTVRDYLSNKTQYKRKGLRVFNLSRSYRYLGLGYYCSLLGEARQQRVLPSVRTLTDLSRRAIYRLNIDTLEKQLDKFARRDDEHQTVALVELDVFFGQAAKDKFRDFARTLFDILPAPLLKVVFSNRNGRWRIESIKHIYIDKLSQSQREFFVQAMDAYLCRRWRKPKPPQSAKLDLAILYNTDELLPPSDRAALTKFVEVGKRMGVNVELIEKRDYPRLAEYDALFIRETTAIDHYTYKFAKKAESEGMVVIDDPNSIVKCTNKVYLFELLTANNIPVPKTQIISKTDFKSGTQAVNFPLVVKIPDGSFSRGIYKVNNADEFSAVVNKLFKDSELVLAQEFMYTEFDWRIGVLNKEIIFACQYFMSASHWQIVKHVEGGRALEGGHRTWPIDQVPQPIRDTALGAAALIGDGLYGVDIKQCPQGIYVIEVNDNPNIDYKVEDVGQGDELYRRILDEFVRRTEQRRSNWDRRTG